MVWLEQAEAGSPQVVATVLDIARSVGDGGDAATAGRRLAEVLCLEPRAVPAMVLVAPVRDGLQAMVHRWGRVVAGEVEIDGGWPDRTLAWTTALRAGRGRGGQGRGVRPGPIQQAERRSRRGLPREPEPGHPHPPRRHPPAVGSLVLDDGTTLGLDASQVIGCDPEQDRTVAAGDADPIVIADPSGQVAPVHGEVRLVGCDVALVPRAEMFVRAAGRDRWAPARPDEPVHLGDGACVALESRTFTVHTDAASAAG